jgi:hypothetical protein
MKNETKNKIIVIMAIIIFVLIGFIIISGIIQRRKNIDYKTEIDGLEKSIAEYGKSNTEFIRINTELEKDKRRFEEIIARNREEIQRLESITIKLRKDTTDAIGIVDEIEKLFSEIMDN